MGKMGKKMGSLLDLLVRVKTHKALDRAVRENKDYQYTLKRQDKAFDRLDNAELSKEQGAIVDKAISTANDCDAAYGAAAYRLGLQDEIRLASEVKEFE